MKNTLLLILFIFTVFYMGEVKAEFLFEPFAGIAINGTAEVESGPSLTLSGSSYGLKFGATRGGLIIGAAVDFATLDSTEKVSKTTDTVSSRLTSLLIGYDTTFMFRFWYKYIVAADNSVKKVDQIYNTGSGYSAGIGYLLIPHVSMNLEYTSYSTSKVLDNATAIEVDQNVSWQYILLSLSFPLKL